MEREGNFQLRLEKMESVDGVRSNCHSRDDVGLQMHSIGKGFSRMLFAYLQFPDSLFSPSQGIIFSKKIIPLGVECFM